MERDTEEWQFENKNVVIFIFDILEDIHITSYAIGQHLWANVRISYR